MFKYDPNEWKKEIAKASPPDLIRDIIRDNRGGPPTAYAQAEANARQNQPTAEAAPAPKGNGWVEPPTVRDWKPPGLSVMDRIMDAQDAADAAERKRRGR